MSLAPGRSMSLLGVNPCINVSAPIALSFASATICTLLSLIAILGNTLVVLAVVLDPNKNLKSPFNLLVANLAIADLIVGAVVEPMSIDFYIREGLELNPVTSLKPQVRRICYFISCTASVLSMAAITVDRFIAIAHPMKYRAELSRKKVLVASIALWVISILCPFLYLSVGYIQYQFFFANTAVLATMGVLLLTYVKVYKEMRHQVKEWDKYHDGSAENRAKKNAIKWERKVTKTFLIVIAIFVACFLPALILIYIINFCENCHCLFIHVARDVNYLLILCNSSINPYLFGWKLQTYRSAFFKIMCGQRFGNRVNSISDSLSNAANLRTAESTGPGKVRLATHGVIG
ncbi:octopamine receptor 1 [Nematostella vectensis]|uniref:octopamine receptor 1 n=1 Tax=Nematostella vectensis TaxID=45351 RepID=UPI00207716B5|nr:octopamine receptor 1 [Nematostella vectensis]